MKLKVKVEYEWIEDVDEQEYIDEYISNVREHYILTGAYQERINKLDPRAENCLPDGYKCHIDINWED